MYHIMADTSKSEKLASARKKFKELKKKKNAALKVNQEVSIAQLSREHTPVDSLTSSTHSSVNEPTLHVESTPVEQPIITEEFCQSNLPKHNVCKNSNAVQMPNYFGSDVCSQDPSTFFDNITSNLSPQNLNRESNQTDHDIFNNPISRQDNVNTFNSYSFQYDTPFNIELNPQKSKENLHTNPNAPEPADVFYKIPTDANTYFTDNIDNEHQSKQEVSSRESENFQNAGEPHNIISDIRTEDLIELLENKEEEIESQYGPYCEKSQSNYFTNYGSSQHLIKEVENVQNFENKDKMENVSHGTFLEQNDDSQIFVQPDELLDIPDDGEIQVHQSTDVNNEVPSQSVSSMESLLQLSNQMAQLIEPTNEFGIQSEISVLEKRNLELAAHLEKEKIKSEQLAASLNESQHRIYELETEDKNKRNDNNLMQMNEISRLREELDSYLQTIGMLVAEKTELSANASQFQLTAQQKTSECEELQNRLKASRSRVADLEKENSNLKLHLSQYGNSESQKTEQVSKLMDEVRKINEEREELLQDLLEAQEKLKTASESNVMLQKQVQELTAQFSLANIKITQLTTSENQQVDQQVEQLVQEKFALEKQVSELTQTLKTVTKERDDSSLQYQQYTQQLNSQLTSLAKKMEQLQLENEALVVQEQNRVKHISELERQLQNLQSEHINHVNYASQKTSSDFKKEYMLALDNFHMVQVQKEKLEQEYTKVANEKDLLLRDLEGKKRTITHLEDLLEQTKENQPDNTKLLAAMESDKVAAARAMSQNIEMKKQMEGMQEVLMKLNNDKVELTEKLTKEVKVNEELMDDLQKTKLHLGTLADAIEIKDKELSNMRYNSEELNRQVLQQGQLTDRLRHYEAQNYSSNALQEELQLARNTVTRLTNELYSLQSSYNESVNQLGKQKTMIDNNAQERDGSNETVVDGTPNMKTTPEVEPSHVNVDIQSVVSNNSIIELQERLKEMEVKNKYLEDELRKLKQENNTDGSATNPTRQDGSDHHTESNSIDKEAAMRHLEEKFLQTMNEIARLEDEKQRLEHLVLQLQGETETIGEYVALYQYQRNILKQKAVEKDQQLKQLAEDRLQMKNNLDQLNALVRKLVTEKGAITSELLKQHNILNNESDKLCEEHSQIHQEISKITGDNLKLNTDSRTDAGTETAEQIIALLSEIKTSNLVQPTESIHPCPWCSGKLITV